MPDNFFVAEYAKKAASEDALVQSGRGGRYEPVALLHTLGEILHLLEVRPGEDLLDAGCAAGLFGIIPGWLGVRVAGVDPVAEMIPIAEANLDGAGTATIKHGHVADLPFEDNSFDKVLVMEVLQLVPPEELQDAFSELERVTRPGGRLLLGSVPDAQYKDRLLPEYLAGLEAATHLSDEQRAAARERNLRAHWYHEGELTSYWHLRGHQARRVDPAAPAAVRRARFHLVIDTKHGDGSKMNRTAARIEGRMEK